MIKYGILLVCAYYVHSAHALPNSLCICTNEYNPVCGTDGITYATKCTLDCAKSNGKEFLAVKHKGECPKQLCPCGRDYRPVCGSDGNTYSNECLFNCERTQKPGLELQYKGKCQARRVKQEAPSGGCVCPYIYAPVCGDDGKMYSNECTMKCQAQETGHPIEVAHKGRC